MTKNHRLPGMHRDTYNLFTVILRPERGASSVLVILMLLMLVVFGVLSYVSASANQRLSEINARTTAAWYEVDRIGEIRTAGWHGTIREASAMTEAYLKNRTFLNGNDVLLAEDARSRIALEWSFLEGEEEQERFLRVLRPKVFYRILLHGTSEGLESDARIISLYDFDKDPELWSVKTELPEGSLVNVGITLNPASDENRFRLEITLEITAPDQEGHRADLRISKWKQVHEAFDYEDNIRLWEGLVE